MAIKEWRKTRDNRRHIEFGKKFSVQRIDIYLIKPHKPLKIYYQIIIKDENSELSTKNFKTKSQAMSYAKSYMRKN